MAENHRAWLDAWNALILRTQERHPGQLAEIGRLCTLHEDNLYTLRRWE